MDTLLEETTLLKLFCLPSLNGSILKDLPSEKGTYSKRKELGANYSVFPF